MVDIRVYPDSPANRESRHSAAMTALPPPCTALTATSITRAVADSMLAGTGSLLGVGRAERRFRHGLG